MLWRGPPCALHALSAGALPCRSLAPGGSAGGSLAGARALLGLLGGPAGKEEEEAPEGARRPRRARPRAPPPPSLVRGCCPSVAAGAQRPPLPRFLLLLLLRRPTGAAEVAQLGVPRAGRSLQAAGSPFRAGAGSAGDGGRLGSRKDTGGSTVNNHTDPGQEDGKKPNKSQQLKKVFKEYGGVAVAFHVGISLMSLGMFYLAVSSGVDMTGILFKLGFEEAVVQSKLAAGTSTFLLAYAIHKLFAPVRISITLISVPLLVRYFRKIGFFKPPAPNP